MTVLSSIHRFDSNARQYGVACVEDRVVRTDAHGRQVATATDRPSRLAGAGDDAVRGLETPFCTSPVGDAGAIPAASTFSIHASTGDGRRQTASKPVIAKSLSTHPEEADSRQHAAPDVIGRPTRATKSATSPLRDDPDLAVVVAAWPELTEAVRAGIMAMVKVATEGHV